MPRFSPFRIAHDARERLREEFFRTIAALRSLEAVRSLMRDPHSPTESLMFMRRLQVAFLLLDGMAQKDVRKRLRVSRSLVRDVSSRLSRNGPGFEAAYRNRKDIEEELDEEISIALKREDPRSFESHMRRFVGYYSGVRLARAAPNMIRNAAAAHARRLSMKRKKKS